MSQTQETTELTEVSTVDWVHRLRERLGRGSSFFLASWLFLRLLALIYLGAFVSFWVQLDGLIGQNGILPAGELLERVRQSLGPDRLWEGYLGIPTLLWLHPADGFLHALCAGGCLLSILLFVGMAAPVTLFLLWVVYLSLVSVGGDFLGFQWDNLLLETGFIAIFLQPFRLFTGMRRAWAPAYSILLLFRFLLFRLNFSSGVVKLRAEDPTGPNVWADLTALYYHYETQPLPTVFGWYAHQLPDWFQQVSVFLMFVIQLGFAFFVFGPRRLRLIGCAGLTVLQVFIFITGNYCFFNLLTLAFCLLLVDDKIFARISFLRPFLEERPKEVSPLRANGRLALVALAFVLLGVTGLTQQLRTLGFLYSPPAPLAQTMRSIAPFRSVNTYGLFANMTTSRPEILVEGSEDGENWKTYEFRYKPGDLSRPPIWAQPHQPRLDWQMWFAALGNYRRNPWFVAFVHRLLEGSPEVLALLAKNPFPDQPPKYIRARMYDYHFTDPKTRRETGNWWSRDGEREYLPAVSLENFRSRDG
jgi:hypothetical protein